MCYTKTMKRREKHHPPSKKKAASFSPLVIILVGILFLLGGVFGFGIYSKITQGKAIDTYTQKVAKDTDYTDEEVKKAIAYNERIVALNKGEVLDAAKANNKNEYNHIFAQNNGIIGILTIPKISAKLPIYHGTSDDALMKGVGHVDDTAFPLDTKGAKSVLTGHNGVLGADMLFTRLDEMKVSDRFQVQVGKWVYHYQIKRIKVLTPEETEHYAQQVNRPENKAEVTLVTCTPYGINTHRLLLIGSFTHKEKAGEKTNKTRNNRWSIGKETVAVLILSIISISTLVYKFEHRKNPTYIF